MPECHKCPYDGKPTSACITCKGPSTHPANHGQRFVSLEHMPPKELAKLVIPDLNLNIPWLSSCGHGSICQTRPGIYWQK